MRQLRAPISIGELIDKISILEIKAERLAEQSKLRNVRAELALLNELKAAAGLDTPAMDRFAAELKATNIALWDIENEIRALEGRQDFGPRFVALAREVYRNNDRRAAIKRQINVAFASEIVEEKSYGDDHAGAQ